MNIPSWVVFVALHRGSSFLKGSGPAGYPHRPGHPHLHLTAHGDSPDLTAALFRPSPALNLSLHCRLCHCAGVPLQQAAGTLTIPTLQRPDRRTRPATPHMTRGQQRTPPA